MADTPNLTWLVDPANGQPMGVDSALAQQYLDRGFQPMDPSAASQIDARMKHRGITEMLKTFGEGAVGTLAPIVGPKLLELLGDEDQLGRRQAHPWAHGAGALAGAVAPLLISGGGSAAAKGAAEGAEAAGLAAGKLGAESAAETVARLGTEGGAAVKAAETLGATSAPAAEGVVGAAGRGAPAASEAAGAAGQVMREPPMPFPRPGIPEAPPAGGAPTQPTLNLAPPPTTPLPAPPLPTPAPAAPGMVGGAVRGAADASFPSVTARLGDRVRQGVLGTDGLSASEAVLVKASLSPAQRIAAEAADQIVQGAMYGGFDALNRATIGDPEMTAEQILAEGLFGGVIGGAFGTAMGGLGEITKGYAKDLVPALRDWEAQRALKAAKGIQSDISRIRKGINEERFKKIALYWSDNGFVGGLQGIDTMDAKATIAMKRAVDDMESIKAAAGKMENATTITDLVKSIRDLESYTSLKHNSSQRDAFAQVESVLKAYEEEPKWGIWGLQDRPDPKGGASRAGQGRAHAEAVDHTPIPVETVPIVQVPGGRGVVEPVVNPKAGMHYVDTYAQPREPVQYAVVELDDLIQSHHPGSLKPNPAYPKGVQERQYHTEPGEKQKVEFGARDFDPKYPLSDTPSPTDGPPIVTSGNKMIVLGGNGRTMILKRALEDPAKALAYQDRLVRVVGDYGINPEQLKGMQKPVLVRMVPHLKDDAPKKDLFAAVRRFNTDKKQELSPIIDAISQAKNMSPETMQDLSNILTAHEGESLRDLLRDQPSGFIDAFRRDGIIHQGNQDTWVVKGQITPEKRKMIELMFLGRIMGTAERLQGAPDKVIKNVEAIAPYLVKIHGANPAASEIGTVQRAVDLISDAFQAKAKTLEEFVAQRPLAGIGEEYDPALLPLAKMLKEKGTNQIKEPFKAWSEKAAFDPNQSTMFAPNPTSSEVRESLFGKGEWTAPKAETAPTAPRMSEAPPPAAPGAPPAAPPHPTAPQERVDARIPQAKRWVGELPTGFDKDTQEIVRIGDKPLSVDDIHIIRQELAGKSRGWQRQQDPTIRAWSEVIDDGRFAVSRRIDDDLEKLGIGSAEWRDANFRYQAMRILRDFLDRGERRAVGNNQITVVGGLGALTGLVTGHVPMGFFGAGVAEFLKHKGSGLQVSMLRTAANALEGVQERSAMTIQEKVKDIFTAAGAASTASAMGSIMASQPTDEQVDEAMANVGAAAGDPNRTALGVERHAGPLIPLAAPSALHLQGKAKAGAGHLKLQVPGPTNQAPLAPKYVPSPTEKNQFRLKLHVMNDPYTVLDHVQVGMLTPAHVEALDAAYPKLANAMRLELGSQLADTMARGGEVPVHTRLSMGMLLGADLDNSYTPQMLMDLQAVHAAQVPSMGPSQAHPAGSGRPRKVDLHLSSSYRTQTQGNEERLGSDSLS